METYRTGKCVLCDELTTGRQSRKVRRRGTLQHESRKRSTVSAAVTSMTQVAAELYTLCDGSECPRYAGI